MNLEIAFKRWFEGSKVVYEDGRPLMVYHGTDSAITAFDAGTSRHGFWFTAAIIGCLRLWPQPHAVLPEHQESSLL